MAKYPRVIKQELVNGKLVEMLDEGPSFGYIQLFVYIDGVQYGPSEHTRDKADKVFAEALTSLKEARS